MVKITGAETMIAGINLWLKETEALAVGVFRGISVMALKHVVYGTPEWSGTLASNWRLSVGAPATGYAMNQYPRARGGDYGSEPFSKQQPNPDAVRVPFHLASFVVPQITLASKVFLTNNTPYAEEVRTDSGPRPIREVNKRIEMTLATADKLNNLGALSTLRAQALARLSKLRAD
jgi:hypothetical protein